MLQCQSVASVLPHNKSPAPAAMGGPLASRAGQIRIAGCWVRFSIPAIGFPTSSRLWRCTRICPGKRSALQNASAPVARSIRRLLPSHDANSADFHVRDAQGVIAPAEALIRDEQIGFVFIHLAVPHPPGVYDRRMQQVRGGSYLDNLALADVDLGSLLQAIASTRSAANTTTMICSDHSWRIPIWRSSAGWTNEDEQLAKGGFDPRPVLLVHFPGEEQGSAISEPVDSLVMHEILQETLRGSIRVQKDFVVWRSTHHLY
jgi:hypothetical protein